MDLNKTVENQAIQSAVLVLHELLTDSLILTKRSNQLRHHPGEICFPGGKMDAEDESLYATALRELDEELGITADRIKLIRKLELERTLAGTIIHSWLAEIDSVSPYTQNMQEVTELIYIPMALVIDPRNYREVILEHSGIRFKSCEFVLNNGMIFGATARIMKQLTLVTSQ